MSTTTRTQPATFTSNDTLTNGDCVHVLKPMPSNSVDLVITDPPYLQRYRSRDGRTILNDDRDNWLLPAFTEIHRVLREGRYMVASTAGRRQNVSSPRGGPSDFDLSGISSA